MTLTDWINLISIVVVLFCSGAIVGHAYGTRPRGRR